MLDGIIISVFVGYFILGPLLALLLTGLMALLIHLLCPESTGSGKGPSLEDELTRLLAKDMPQDVARAQARQRLKTAR